MVDVATTVQQGTHADHVTQLGSDEESGVARGLSSKDAHITDVHTSTRALRRRMRECWMEDNERGTRTRGSHEWGDTLVGWDACGALGCVWGHWDQGLIRV
jgi:hypothetical protein